MGWTKRHICEEAFAELALAGHTVDLTPEEMQTALRRLDTRMAAWETAGLRVGYAIASSPKDSDLDQDSGLLDGAVEPAYTALAIILAGVFGKEPLQDTRNAAKMGYDSLLKEAAMPREMQFPETLPRGAGNKYWRTWRGPFVPPPDFSPLGTTQGEDLDVLPE